MKAYFWKIWDELERGNLSKKTAKGLLNKAGVNIFIEVVEPLEYWKSIKEGTNRYEVEKYRYEKTSNYTNQPRDTSSWKYILDEQLEKNTGQLV